MGLPPLLLLLVPAVQRHRQAIGDETVAVSGANVNASG